MHRTRVATDVPPSLRFPVSGILSAMRALVIVLLVLAPLGCVSHPKGASSDPAMFGAVSMRIHPIFTQLQDWSGDGKIDGIEALIEFQDQFGDPCKAAGSVMFEIFPFRQYNANPRGQRLVEPYLGSIKTVSEQRDRWNRTSRTYQFQLADKDLKPNRSYVLSATFDYGGARFFDQVVIDAEHGTQRWDEKETSNDSMDSIIPPPPTSSPPPASPPTTAPSTPEQ